MKNKLQILTLALLTLIFTSGYSGTRTWNGSSSGSWTNNANWSGGNAPSSGDDVIIPNLSGLSNAPSTNISGTIKSLTMNAGSGTLTLTGNMVIRNNVVLNGGSLNINGFTFEINGDIKIDAAATIQSTGVSRIDATGAKLDISGGNLLLNNVELVIDDLDFSTNNYINSSNGGFLSFDNSSGHSLTSVDNASHVNAKVRLYTKNGNNNIFFFPIGNGAVYSPFIFEPTNITGNGTFSQWVEATYFGTKSSQTALDLTTLDNASGYEYWTVASSSTSVIGTVALRYDNNGSKTGKSIVGSTTNLSNDLKLAQYSTSTSKWIGIASSNAANTPSSGITTSTSSSAVNPTSNWTLSSNNSRTTFLVPLPVSLINFDVVANKNSKSVEVKWATATEENNSHFEIMHSTDFINWTSIGTVYSKGNGNEMNVYTFTDFNPSANNHYKLKIVANNGDIAYTSIKLAKFTEIVSAIVNVFPNPANANVNLSIDNMDMTTPVTIQLVNPMGQVVFEQIITENLSGMMSTSIPTAELAAGIYQVTISGTTGTVSQKLIINH